MLNFARSFLAVTLTRFKRPERGSKINHLNPVFTAHVIVNLKCRDSRWEIKCKPGPFVSKLARFVIDTDFGDVRHLLAAFEDQSHLL